jgi:hypothetical protein
VQPLPSLHIVPFGLAGLEQVPFAGSHVPASWHWSLAVQITGFDPLQVPLSQVSVCVQPLPSLQLVPLGLAGLEQVPFAGLHVPASWHWSLAVHTTRFEPVHVPLWQVSVCVQPLPSLQLVPFGLVGVEQLPFAGSQVPASWHWSLAVQTTGFEPVHAPDWQVSVCVQALPSLQVAPSGLAGLEQAPFAELQVPASWHWSLGVHTTGFEPVHAPD